MTHRVSKTVAAWLALLLGTLGIHRFYVYGMRDVLGWLHPLPTLLGLIGVDRMRSLGQDDRLATLLIPLLGLMITQATLTAIVWGLTADDRWNARHNRDAPDGPSGWGAVIAAVIGLMIGGGVLMGTIAFSVQRYFEWQLLR